MSASLSAIRGQDRPADWGCGMAARTNGGERAEFVRENELGKAADFEVGTADPPGERCALGQVAFTVGNPQAPRLNDAQRAA